MTTHSENQVEMSDPNTTASPPAYALILDQAAHLDWDWIRSFAQNYWYFTGGTTSLNAGVDTILQQAIKNITDQQKAGGPAYYYTICEMGFLRRFIETRPEYKALITSCGDQFQIISGGITSPDCLLSSGEAFVRNYLVGQKWASCTLGVTPKPYCWLPDDFGQGPQLPTLLTASGFVAVSFSRLPGTYRWTIPVDQPSYKPLLQEQGFDFTWQASDGSDIFTHWMVDRYGLGNDIAKKNMGIDHLIHKYRTSQDKPHTYPGAATPYMYIPIDDDFTTPVTGLAGIIEQWNTTSAASENVTVQQGTFDMFYSDIQKYNAQSPGQTVLKQRNYNGTPYLTGCYASRPELKRLHYETSRALVAAEVIGLLTQPGNTEIKSLLPMDFWDRLDQAWMDFLPSTHHDFVTGTAPDAVYLGDQLPLLRGIEATSHALRAAALNSLGAMTSTTATSSSSCSPGVIVANTLGFTRSGVVDVGPAATLDDSILWTDGTTQVTPDSNLLVYTTASSFGYTRFISSDTLPKKVPIKVTLTPQCDGQTSYTLSNEFLTATISEAAGWGISELKDSKSNNVLKTGGEPGHGNEIVFYNDSQRGGIYSFSNEFNDKIAAGGCMPEISDGDVSVQTSGAGLGPLVLETGPLRARLKTEVQYTIRVQDLNNKQDSTSKVRFTREYELRAGEPFLRMTTTGSAPVNTSVMVKFALSNTVTGFTHGTAYHWNDYTQLDPAFWKAPCFQPTHDFVVPYNGGVPNTPLAAIYHGSTPAWAFDSQGALIGCVFRNAQAFRTGEDPHGAYGTDSARWTQSYAIRVPLGLGSPETCQPLQEAQSFHTPLYGLQLPNGDSDTGHISASTGTIASAPVDSQAILTVAKPGSYDHTSLVLRVYQPTNKSLDVALSLSTTLPAPTSATLVTATETEWNGRGSVNVAEGGGVMLSMAGAVATVSLAGLGR